MDTRKIKKEINNLSDTKYMAFLKKCWLFLKKCWLFLKEYWLTLLVTIALIYSIYQIFIDAGKFFSNTAAMSFIFLLAALIGQPQSDGRFRTGYKNNEHPIGITGYLLLIFIISCAALFFV